MNTTAEGRNSACSGFFIIQSIMAAACLAAAVSASAQVTTLAQDAASNYSSFTGNQGFGFGEWVVNTPGGGKYISADTPPYFGIWNRAANSVSKAVRPFNSSLAVGRTFSVQLMMNTLDGAENRNGILLQDAAGNVLFSYWHQGGDIADGHYSDATTANGMATGFAYDYRQMDSFAFTLTGPTNYTFADLSTGAHFDGTLGAAPIAQVTFFRSNGAGTPSSGQDFKFDELSIAAPSVAPGGSSLAYEGFDYPVGGVGSQNGGFGWGASWTNVAGNAMYFDLDSLIGDSNAPAVYDAFSQGNHLRGYGGSRVGRMLDCSPDGAFGQNGCVNASGHIGVAGKTVYLSFLEQSAHTSKFFEFELHRGDYGDAGRIAGIGNDTGSTNLNMRLPNGTHASLGGGNTEVNFYVVRIDFHGGNDDVRVYRNPASVTEPTVPTLTRKGVGNMSFDRVCLGAWDNFVALDELRIGTEWTNVIGLASQVIGNASGPAITNAMMIGEGIAAFVPDGYDSNRVPSMSLVSEPVSSGSLAAGWLLVPQFTVVNSNACASVNVPDGTSLYGGGEVAGPLLRNGQTIEIWNTDTAGWSTENLRRMYQAHPWVLGVRPDGSAFGVLFDTTYKATLTTANTRIVFRSHGPLFRVFIIDRDSPQAVLKGLGELTGTMPMPPRWALGYHQSRFSYMPASQVQGVANGFLTNQIPCDAIWLDIGYMKNNRDFTIDSASFPNMPSLSAWLHNRGFHVVPILDPPAAVDSTYWVYQSGSAKDLWVQTSRGQPYQAYSTPGFAVWPDFTMPTARNWWMDLCRDFMTNGMDGLWIDMNEPSANNSVTALNSMPYDNWHRGGGGLPAGAHLMYHNAYAALQSVATYKALLAANPNRRPFVLTRASFIGGQRYAATWTGDNVSSTNNMLMSVPMSLTLGLSGQPFSGPDLGGFIADATPELWGNWVGFGAFFPFCRGHTTIGTSPKEPWAFGESVETAARVALQRRYRLMPYLYTVFYNSSQTGIPVMQPVFFADPKDLSLRAEQQAFLLGSDLLVIPSWAQKPALPKGIWRPVSLVSGDSGLYQAELRVRGGAILPAGGIIQNTTQNMFDPLTLIVCLDESGHAEGTLYRDAGEGWGFRSGDYKLQTFTAQASGEFVTVQLAAQQGGYSISDAQVDVQVITSNGTFHASGVISSGIRVPVDARTARAQAAFDAYNAAFLVRTNGQTYYKRSLNDSSYAGSWVQALEIQLAADAYERTKSIVHKQLVSELITTFLAKENYNWALDTWNDDIAWMTIACLRAYRITGNTALLNKAVSAWNMAYNRGWDSALGGGIWEEMNLRDAKCALSNDPMIIAGAALYEITGEPAYLAKCQQIYTWVRNSIFNPANGQVYEGVRSNGTVLVSDNVYNSGAFINAANCLYKITRDTNYFQDALLAAKHVMENNEILTHHGRGDSCWEDQLVRGLASFARDNGLWGLYGSWLAANADAAWDARRRDLNITWNSWTSPTPADDCFSLECLSAAVIQQVLPALVPGAPEFVIQPADQITANGNTLTISARANSEGAPRYRWYHESDPIAGATNSDLVLARVGAGDAGAYWVAASNTVAGAYSYVAHVYLIGNTNGLVAQDSATNYDSSTGFAGNRGFGFGPWLLSTVGGGGYISGDNPPLFGLWNNTSGARSTASRRFSIPLMVGSSFLVQLQMSSLDAGNQNGFQLQDQEGNTVFSFWHEGGDAGNGHYTDAGGSGVAAGFAFNSGRLDSFRFTLNSATSYTFTDLTMSKSFSGVVSGTGISRVIFFRVNDAGPLNNGQDFKIGNLSIVKPPMVPGPETLALGMNNHGMSLNFPVAPGYRYRLQRTTDVLGSWIDMGTLTGPATGLGVFLDTNLPATQAFYRTVTP